MKALANAGVSFIISVKKNKLGEKDFNWVIVDRIIMN